MANKGKVIAVVAGIIALLVVGMFAIKWIEFSPRPASNLLRSISGSNITPRSKGIWYIQVQSMLLEDQYTALAEYMKSLGYRNLKKVLMSQKVGNNPVFILRLGPYVTREDSVADLDRFKAFNSKKPFAEFPKFRLQLAYPIEVLLTTN